MFAKDPITGIVHNFNETELKTNIALRERIKKEKDHVKKIDELTLELTEIKDLFKEILKDRQLNDLTSR